MAQLFEMCVPGRSCLQGHFAGVWLGEAKEAMCHLCGQAALETVLHVQLGCGGAAALISGSVAVMVAPLGRKACRSWVQQVLGQCPVADLAHHVERVGVLAGAAEMRQRSSLLARGDLDKMEALVSPRSYSIDSD